ncbi:MAG TPA: nickel pincer cofactor biosynthesis protein LarC [Candidatus Binatia bacterium]|nr:nickel pincer cofactor biosynthesis protein LarC [Candidatus Binatia bacterium]
MRIVYGDLIGGASGDMFAAALLDLGLPLAALKAELKKIPGLKYRLEVGGKKVGAIRAARFRVVTAKKEPDRSWAEIRRLLRQSALEEPIKERALDIFTRLAAAEGKVHGVAPERVHFHEVGATDSIVDIVSAAVGSRHLKIDAFYFSRIPLGRGVTRSRHGPLPLPGPATLELLKGLPVEWIDLQAETVTPTGAAIIASLGKGFGAAPEMKIEKIGCGAGAKEFPHRPNLLRLVMGEDQAPADRDAMLVIETNIDDMSPELYDYAFERLFAAGARDVFLTPVQMKKNRPGILLSVVGEASLREKLTGIIFSETSTIGVRYYPVERAVLKREIVRVKTKYGSVKVKVVEQPDGARRGAPEYDDVKRIAARKKVPLKAVYDEALRNFSS